MLAEDQFPDKLSVLENRASIMLENDEFEKSLITYLNISKKKIKPIDFTLGVLKVFFSRTNTKLCSWFIIIIFLTNQINLKYINNNFSCRK